MVKEVRKVDNIDLRCCLWVTTESFCGKAPTTPALVVYGNFIPNVSYYQSFNVDLLSRQTETLMKVENFGQNLHNLFSNFLQQHWDIIMKPTRIAIQEHVYELLFSNCHHFLYCTCILLLPPFVEMLENI